MEHQPYNLCSELYDNVQEGRERPARPENYWIDCIDIICTDIFVLILL